MCPHEGSFVVKLTEKAHGLMSTLCVQLFFAFSSLSTSLVLLDTGHAYVFIRLPLLSLSVPSSLLACWELELRYVMDTIHPTDAILSCNGLVEFKAGFHPHMLAVMALIGLLQHQLFRGFAPS